MTDDQQPPAEQDTVDLIFEDDSGKAYIHYVPTNGPVKFTSTSAAAVVVGISDPPEWTGPKVFRVRLAPTSTNVSIGSYSAATITITDEDSLAGPFRWIDGSISSVWAVHGARWLIAGEFAVVDGYSRLRLARLESDGAIDASFDASPGPNGPVHVVVAQPDGKLLVGGAFSEFAGHAARGLVRLLPDGELDPSFSISEIGTPDGTPVVRALEIEPAGSIMVGGSNLSNSGSGLVRLGADGLIDSSFTAPVTVTNVHLVKRQPNGAILAAGSIGPGSTTHFLVRVGTNGVIDPSFNAELSFGQRQAVRSIYDLLPRADGTILVGGAPPSSDYMGLLLLDESGRTSSSQLTLYYKGKPLCGGVASHFETLKDGAILISGLWGIETFGCTWNLTSLFRIRSDLVQDFFTLRANTIDVGPFAVQPNGLIGGLGSQGNAAGKLSVYDTEGQLLRNPYIAGLALAPGGELHLALRGFASPLPIVESSTNLVNWQVLTNSAAGMILKLRTDADAQRYFRVR